MSGKRLSKILAAIIVVIVSAVYVMLRLQGNGDEQQAAYSPSPKTSVSSSQTPFNSGKMITFVIKKPKKLPVLKFQDGMGKDRSLADWRGKFVLINLWATWCAPCRHEMPALARLDKAFENKPFDVVAISIDRKGIAVSAKFLKEIKVADQLGLYADPTSRISQTLKAYGLPVSILVDPKGREIGRLTGPAEWDSKDAKRLIEAAMAGKLHPGR